MPVEEADSVMPGSQPTVGDFTSRLAKATAPIFVSVQGGDRRRVVTCTLKYQDEGGFTLRGFAVPELFIPWSVVREVITFSDRSGRDMFLIDVCLE